MAELIDHVELGESQEADIREGGEVWIHDNGTAQDIKLDAKAATLLIDFLLLYQERLIRERDVAVVVKSEETRQARAQAQATRDWHTRARVRIIETTIKHSVEPAREHTFHAGDELEMIQWGRAGRPVDRSAWWTSYDIDGAFIVESDKVEVLRILEETQP